ncbi:alpha/beta hydrolase [Phyllobacterium salinisoli]|uniref:Alpha/beta hydrolase n=1 Tax=Phyllobacterium salinisoli TaxID=1899321 RepID=A0A368K6G0_9HYPH|nr:alpha/beta hydrolase [Phyllobacterium salinisoli]RCS23952.1 alpha/beta hydrolase [Phyllobacterium salinisoli]
MSMETYHYRMHPASAPGAPLMFVFHGTGGDENQFFDLGRQLLPGAGIVSPRGDVLEHGAARFFRRTGEGVYDMADLHRRTKAMADFVRAHIEAEKPSAVIGLGYSNGANILASILLDQPHLFKAAILMHPLIPWQPAEQPDLKGRRVLITAGRQDPICPPAFTTRLGEYLTAQGSDTIIEWHSGGHEIRQSELAAINVFTEIYRR